MTNVQGNPNDQWEGLSTAMVLKDETSASPRQYDLAERTARFGEEIIRFAKRVPRNPVTIPLIGQLVRCGTSVGANYCEADDAVSKKEFRNKIGTCKKEAKETKYFLRMMAAAEETTREQARRLYKEARELHLIFCSIFNKWGMAHILELGIWEFLGHWSLDIGHSKKESYEFCR